MNDDVHWFQVCDYVVAADLIDSKEAVGVQDYSGSGARVVQWQEQEEWARQEEVWQAWSTRSEDGLRRRRSLLCVSSQTSARKPYEMWWKVVTVFGFRPKYESDSMSTLATLSLVGTNAKGKPSMLVKHHHCNITK